MRARLFEGLAILGLMIGPANVIAFGQNFVAPGGSGAIDLDIENIGAADHPLEGIKIIPRVEPVEFSDHITFTPLARGDIAGSQTVTFTVNFQVDATVPTGSFNVILHADPVSMGTDPDLTDPVQDTSVSFQVARFPPRLTLSNEYGQSMPHGSFSQSARINSIAIHNPASVRSLEFFVGNVPGPVVYATPGNPDIFDSARKFATDSWHYVRACDVALNCVYSLFGVFPSDMDLSVPGGGGAGLPPPPPGPPPACPGCTQRPNPNPGQPWPPPDDPNNPPPPPWPPLPPGEPTPPVCRGKDCLNEPPAPTPTWVRKPRWPKFCERTPRNCNIPVGFPHDPNAKYGPSGYVAPGQLMTYTIEFENEGEGLALETFVRETLDPALDGTALVLRDMHRVNFLTGTETVANFPWSYDDRTRTITVLTGDADSRQGGRFIVETRLKADTVPGTIITNQAVVHFPNSLEVTPTNVIVSAVPLPTLLAYEGASSTTFLAPTRFAVRLTAAGRPLVEQPIEFVLAGSSWIVTTDGSGLAAISTAIAVLPGSYSLQARYLGDGLLYSARETAVDFVIAKKPVRLDTPFAAARSTETARLFVTLSDDEGHPLNAQTEDPKTIHLDLLQGGGVITPLGSALLSGTSVAFEIALPRPLQISWSVRARFDGDSRYAAAISTGVLQLIDQTPPMISILSPTGGRTYSSSQLIPIDFTAQDSEDPAPVAAAVLVSNGGQSVPVSAGNPITASSLSPGQWSLMVQATDWAGNQAAAQGASFQVLSVPDVLAPSTSLSIGLPKVGTDPVFISSATIIGLTAIDDLTTAGDGIGTGVERIEYALDGSSSTLFVGDFMVSTEGAHNIVFFSADFAGNVEPVQLRALFVDSIPPVTRLLVGGLPASTTDVSLISTEVLSFLAEDSGSGVAGTFYTVDGTTNSSVSVSSFTLSVGMHALTFHSLDKLGNTEAPRAVALTVRAADGTPPILSLAPPAGSTMTTTRPALVASYGDSASGVDVASVRLTLDGVDVSALAVVTSSEAVFVPIADLAQGTHTATAQVSDMAGNHSSAMSTFLVDSMAPVTALLVNGLPAATTSVVVISTDSMGFAATDGGTGVLETRYTLDASTVSFVFRSTFSLTVGTHTLAFHSIDRAGNIEATRTLALGVLVYDVTPPSLALTPPNSGFVTTLRPAISALYSDSGRGVDRASVRLTLDAADVTAFAVVTAFSAVFTPTSDLAQGAHTATAQLSDLAGNHATAASSFFLDSIPPVTTLLIDGLSAGTTSLVLISTDTLGFAAADAGAGVLTTLYTLDASTIDAVFVSTFSLAVGTHTLAYRSLDRAGNVEPTRSVAINVLLLDAVPPSLALSPVNGSTLTTTTPAFIAGYSDLGGGVNTASVRLSLDGVDRTSVTIVTASLASFTPSAALAQGTHTVTAAASDFAGNTASAVSAFFIDSLPPMTALLVNGLTAGGTTLALVSTDLLGFAAVDAGVGVLETLYSVDGATEAVFMAPFVLSTGSHALAFHSRDGAGNLEAARIIVLAVSSPSGDSTPPLVRLDFPGSTGLGVEQAVGGIVNVRGAVADASAVNWTLDAAPGASAASGFTAVASGSGNRSGLIAAWNTTSLSGYRTLRLRATDAFGNTASATATVFVGKPVLTFAIGRKDSNVIVGKIKNPTGIAARTDGKIWVASTDEDELLLLTPSGAVVSEVDGKPRHGHGHDDDDAPGFKNPQGLALDAANSLYVADKGNDRIVKLSPDGAQVLLQIAKQDNHGRPRPGSGPGELRQPQDVAVDGNGDIYAADSGNHRIQVFNSSGTFLRQFGPGVLPAASEVRGLALTGEGLWVSDRAAERVFLFSRAGTLIKSIGDADSAVGEISRMRGLAADSLGALYVVEPNRDRTQKFDPQGKGLLVFGDKSGLSHADKQAKRYLTAPIDAAVAPDGSIWITDSGRDRIVRYALPASGGHGVAAYFMGGGIASFTSEEPAKRVVDALDGAKVERDDGAGVHVPVGALSDDLEITVDKGDENQDREQKVAKRAAMKLQPASEEVQYGPEGTAFNAPVTLILPYDANLVAAQGLKEEELKAYYWNPTLKDWQALNSVVDKENKTVSAQTTHFSGYQVQGPGNGVRAAAIDEFSLRDGYAFPNPSRNGSAVTFRIQPGLADSVEVRIYDLSGRKVHSSSDFRFNVLDDGNGKGNQNTYDHAWDVSGIASGVYTFVITAKKSGQTDIRKSGKVGVIK